MQLAIAKTGAAWLPFDGETPVDRIKVCLDDASAAGLVSCMASAAPLTGFEPAWAPRVAKGADALLQHAREGFNAFSKLRPVFYQARFSTLRFMMPPYGKFASRLLAFLTR